MGKQRIYQDMPVFLNKKYISSRLFVCALFKVLLLNGLFYSPSATAEEDVADLTGKEIVTRCGVKNAGLDQRSRLTVILQNVQQGTEKKSVYQRYWKSYGGVDSVFDKMLLFTEYPPDAVGSSFMRVAYEVESGKKADQWIYLPLLKKIRRVTIRDPNDSFLNSDLSYADVSQRPVDADHHDFLGIKRIKEMELYQVASVPAMADDPYGKRVQWFLKGESWDDCSASRIDYFTNKGALEKTQFIKWQQVDGVWVWDRVLVRNMVSGHVSVFGISDVEVNIGMDDAIFSARTLRTGLKALLKKGLIGGSQ